MWIYGTIVLLCCLTVQGEEECEPGKYGDGCSQNCSKNCEPLSSGIVPCHKETGECYEGCKAGVYGDQCGEPCSTHCQGHICNQHNGHCTLGCIENHFGDFCEIFSGITTVHQGTTSSSHTTVTTDVVQTSSSQVIIPAVVTVLVFILILVGAVVIVICRRKKRKKKKSSPLDGQDKQDVYLKDPELVKEIQEMKGVMMSMWKMMYGAPQPSNSSVFSPVSETQIECGRRETLRGSNQSDSASSEWIALIHATSGEGDTPMSGTTSRPDTRATPTPARRDARAEDDLRAACKEGNLAEVKWILDTGRAYVNFRSVFAKTPVMWAAGQGHRDVVKLLVSRGADVSPVDDDGDNTLHYACVGGDRKTVEFVLSLDWVDINSRGQGSRTPVMAAAVTGHRDVVNLLVSRGADVSLVDDDGNNILHCACKGGDKKTVEFVLSRDGVDINVRNNSGETAVDVARREGHTNVVKLLEPSHCHVM